MYKIKKEGKKYQLDFSHNGLNLDFIDVKCGNSNLLLLENGMVLEWGYSFYKSTELKDVFEKNNITQIY